MGLTLEQAMQQFDDGTLPRTLLGCDVDMLLRMLDESNDEPDDEPDDDTTDTPPHAGRSGGVAGEE